MAFRFSDLWKRPTDTDVSKQQYTIRPAPRKMDGGSASNYKLLKGLYTGSNQDFALAAYFSGGMVNVPKNLTGVPGIIPDEGEDERLVKELNPLLVDEFPLIVSTMLIQGTAWRWPRWNDKLRRLVWEAMPDSSVTAIILDLDTGEINELWTDEQIQYREGELNTVYAERKRHITRSLVTEDWTGRINKTVQYKNPFGFLPVPFGHDCYEGEWRGNSVFARVLRVLRSSHEIAYKRDQILSEFEPKIVQNVKDVHTWISNNTEKIGSTEREFDPFGRKLFLNQEGEMTNFIYLPGDATSQHTLALESNQKKIIMGSGIPELFFGGLATGNYASTETDRLLALDYVKGIRRELTKGTEELINQSLKILGFTRFTEPPRVSIEWGNLSLMSEMEKAQIMGAYASAMSSLLQTGSISADGALFLTKELYPAFPVHDEQHFMQGLAEMVTEHSSRLEQPTFEAGDMGMGEM
jgi:hypothetical protein